MYFIFAIKLINSIHFYYFKMQVATDLKTLHNTNKYKISYNNLTNRRNTNVDLF